MRPRSCVRSASVWAALVLFVYVVAVASHAVLWSPTPTPVLDRSATAAFLAQVGHVDNGRTEYGYWHVDPPPDRVVRATLALEDRHFWRYPGVDPGAVLRAAWQHLTGRGRSGASTIAMQVARMQHPRPRTLWAKAVEAGTAVALTARYGHAAVLAQYLRLVPYGNGSHGIAHAARYLLRQAGGRPELGGDRAALRPFRRRRRATIRCTPPVSRARVQRGARALDDLADQDVITAAELPLARAQLADDAAAAGAAAAGCAARHPASRARWCAPGSGPAVDPADPRLRTTLDLRIAGGGQRRCCATIWPRGAVPARSRPRRWWCGAATTPCWRRSGRRRWRSAGGAIDFSRAPRSPGSTLKPFLYALALDRGVLAPDEIMLDRPEGAAGISNADGGFLGPLLPRQALANSRNVPAANLLRRIGLDTAFDALRDLGMHDLEGPADTLRPVDGDRLAADQPRPAGASLRGALGDGGMCERARLAAGAGHRPRPAGSCPRTQPGW